MATTSLIVETLIAGFQTLIGLILGLLLFRGTTWIKLSDFKDWVSLLLLFTVSIAYALGIIIERTASIIMRYIDDRASSQKSGAHPLVNPGQKRHDKSSSAKFPKILRRYDDRFAQDEPEQKFSHTEMRMRIMRADPTISSFIESYRYQYRLLAATTLNLFIYLILIFLAWSRPFFLSQDKKILDFAKNQAPTVLVILLILFLFTVWHWWRMRYHLYKYIEKAHDILYPQEHSITRDKKTFLRILR